MSARVSSSQRVLSSASHCSPTPRATSTALATCPCLSRVVAVDHRWYHASSGSSQKQHQQAQQKQQQQQSGQKKQEEQKGPTPTHPSMQESGLDRAKRIGSKLVVYGGAFVLVGTASLYIYREYIVDKEPIYLYDFSQELVKTNRDVLQHLGSPVHGVHDDMLRAQLTQSTTIGGGRASRTHARHPPLKIDKTDEKKSGGKILKAHFPIFGPRGQAVVHVEMIHKSTEQLKKEKEAAAKAAAAATPTASHTAAIPPAAAAASTTTPAATATATATHTNHSTTHTTSYERGRDAVRSQYQFVYLIVQYSPLPGRSVAPQPTYIIDTRVPDTTAANTAMGLAGAIVAGASSSV